MASGIVTESVRKVFGAGAGATVALDTFSLDVAANEFVAIVGPSGCGKSTLLRLAAGLLPATSGSISVFGKAVAETVTDVGIVFQQPILLDWRDVLDNVLFQIDMRGLDVATYRPRAEIDRRDFGRYRCDQDRRYALPAG